MSILRPARRIVLPVGAVLAVACHSDATGPGSLPSNDLRDAFSHGTCTGTGAVRYAASPMAIADIGQFVPLGLVVGAHVTPIDHQYLSPIDFNSPRSTYNVYAPFNGHIVLIQPRVKNADSPGIAPVGSVDYRVVFEGSCTYWVYYDLITDLEPSLLAAGGSSLAAHNSVSVRIAVTAGQLVGKVGGQTLDLGTVDASVTLPGLLVPDHYRAEPWKIHSMDALDYFDEPLRSQLLAKNRRLAAPRGGKIDFDIDGKAVGNWFLVGTNGYGGLVGEGGGSYWAGHFAFAYGNIDPTMLVMSVGFADGSSKQWAVRGNAPDPASVDASSGIVKYEVMNVNGDSLSANTSGFVQGVVLLQVLPGRQLRVEYFAGASAAAVTGFTAGSQVYER